MSTRKKAYFSTAGLGLLLALLPFLVGAGFGAAWVRVLDFVLLYVLLALGLNIVVGFAGLLDLGYVAFYAVGAYLYALLSSPHLTEHFPALAAHFPGGLHFPVWLVLPAGALLAGAFGVLLGFPTLRLRGDYLAIVTLGFGEIIRIFLNNLYQPVNLTNGALGLTQIDGVRLGPLALDRSQQILGITVPSLHLYYYLFLLLALAIILVSIRLEDSRIGRAWVAIREDEVAAKACGINTRNVKLLAFAMGASFGGVAGGLFAGFQQFVSPESFQLIDSIMILCMVVLGGMGHIPGVIFGAVLLTVLPEAFRYGAGPVQKFLFGQVLVDPEALRMLLFGLTLVLVMLFRPAGLWPDPRHRREMRR
ncbi:ABC transporter permease subunit [Denitratisoma oestradiolicum]|uniref:Leucine/isoleucine/valine transporter subunit membrane component of ABC superfamily n=1 Tax=Denitratisoma oestradiolicum TaxID=311182 RepID=A0A6S6XNT0_9PROT|nr:ABC transporter ATP-binding protein [Denitratisoma oestradiolicum]TWO79732.1 ABC transporter ATP-binding protein [Denitratisoma oestradiolicum]CAB1367496.1 leucine/isoleucine/valine transporter subunit; membrane component of ABC superfamily [Denitratisoma oestradiolicum]